MVRALKGGVFERAIAVKLSTWWSNDTADDWFWRSQASGARATVRGKVGKTTANAAGDISACCPEADALLRLMSLELKRGYNAISIQDMLDKPGKMAQLEEFMQQAIKSAYLAGTPFWALVLKRDRRNELVVLNHWPFPHGTQPSSSYITFDRPMPHGEQNTRMYMILMDDFLCTTVREYYKQLLQETAQSLANLS